MITIVDDVKLIIEDLNGTNYQVQASVINYSEEDTYVVEVFNLSEDAPSENRYYKYYCDSSGNIVEEDWVLQNDTTRTIHDELMKVIKGF